jgi:AraC-like DNA-binding protein
MPADALSDVLRTIRLTGATFFRVVARAPWVAEQPGPGMILPKILPGAERMIAYHVVTEGECFASIIGGEPMPVEAGEVVVFTRGDPHVMSSSPGMRGDPFAPAVIDAALKDQLPFFINFGSDGATSAKLICGFLAYDTQLFNPLLESLPSVFKAGDPRSSPSHWLGRLIDLTMIESANKRPGGESVLARLSELMFIEVVRLYLQALPEQDGWFAGLCDPQVGKALTAIHRNPAKAWTLNELAKQTGLSRSVFADRFTALVGVSPIQYLAKWRMQLASGLLSGGRAKIANVAAEVGYASEAAFSRAFKKMVGLSPSGWRNRPTHRASRPMLRTTMSRLAVISGAPPLSGS